MSVLKNKTILLFSPKGSCIHYSTEIVRELEMQGAEVYFYDERPSQLSIVKILVKKLKLKVPQFFGMYIKYIIAKHKRKSFDYIFIIRGEGFTPYSMSLLKKAYPKACHILYMWDMLATVDTRNITSFFDKVFTFDPDDHKQIKNSIFRPSFYIDIFKDLSNNNNKKEYDIFFAGSIYANRYEYLNNLKNILSKKGLTSYIYFYLPSFFLFIRNYLLSNRRLKAKIQDFNYKPITLKESIDILRKSVAVLDVRYSNQKSISFRAFEALGAHMKLVTNNPEIKKYDFYDKNNIYVIEDKALTSLETFLRKPFCPPPKDIYEKYSLKKWIMDIFEHPSD